MLGPPSVRGLLPLALAVAVAGCRVGADPAARPGTGSGGAPQLDAAAGAGGNGGGAPGEDGAAAGDGGDGATEAGAAEGGAGGAGGRPPPNEPPCVWPAATATQALGARTMRISGTFDGAMQRFTGEGDGQEEGNPAVFQLADGTTLANVIIGAPAGDGIHCRGSCTLRNVWWEDVGEDAATLEGSSESSETQMMIVEGGGARAATDKVFQHNGPGTVIIRNFCVQDFGKLYRSCGNCGTQHTRHVIVDGVSATPGATTAALVGINQNYGDSAMLHGIVVHGTGPGGAEVPVCLRFEGNDTGAEPTPIGMGADAMYCLYDPLRDFLRRPPSTSRTARVGATSSATSARSGRTRPAPDRSRHPGPGARCRARRDRRGRSMRRCRRSPRCC